MTPGLQYLSLCPLPIKDSEWLSVYLLGPDGWIDEASFHGVFKGRQYAGSVQLARASFKIRPRAETHCTLRLPDLLTLKAAG